MAKAAFRRKKIKLPSRRRRGKSDKPDRKLLRAIYRELYTATSEVRVQTLITALHWYDNAWLWLQSQEDKFKKLTAAQLKAAAEVDVWRAREQAAKEPLAKEEHLKKAIEKYESVLVVLHPKSLKSVYEKTDKIKARLEKKADRLLTKYEKVIGTLLEALQPTNINNAPVRIRVAEMEKPWQFTGDLKTLLCSKRQAQFMLETHKQRGLLHVVRAELKGIATMCATKEDTSRPSGYTVDTLVRWEKTWKMFDNLLDFCDKNPKLARRLVRVRRKRRKKDGAPKKKKS